MLIALQEKEVNKLTYNEGKKKRCGNRIRKGIEELRKNGGAVKEESFWKSRRKFVGRKQEILQR